MWQPGLGGSLGENGYLYSFGWVPSLFTYNYHNSNWLYPNIKLVQLKKKNKWRLPVGRSTGGPRTREKAEYRHTHSPCCVLLPPWHLSPSVKLHSHVFLVYCLFPSLECELHRLSDTDNSTAVSLEPCLACKSTKYFQKSLPGWLANWEREKMRFRALAIFHSPYVENRVSHTRTKSCNRPQSTVMRADAVLIFRFRLGGVAWWYAKDLGDLKNC